MTEPEPAPVWQLGAKRITLDRPRLMAIVNVTPDSFYPYSRLEENGPSPRKALQGLIDKQPDIIDVGGQSTRPGSHRVTEDEELKRIIPVIELLRERSRSQTRIWPSLSHRQLHSRFQR